MKRNNLHFKISPFAVRGTFVHLVLQKMLSNQYSSTKFNEHNWKI